MDNLGTVNLQVLLARGADIDAQDRAGNTALMYAARMGKSKTLRVILCAKKLPE